MGSNYLYHLGFLCWYRSSLCMDDAMKNYEPIEEQHMWDAQSGALIFWLSVAVCIWLVI